jgi:PAS domain S-box-containing protein
MHLLYIEDNPQDVDLTRRALAKAGGEFALDAVPTLKEAIRRVEKETFDLLLCDMGLPDGSALDLIKALGGREDQPAIVVITGWGDEETAVAMLKAGADDYLVKRRDYLDILPAVLTAAYNRHQEESHRHAEPLYVLYSEHSLADVDLTTRHMTRVAPHIHLDIAKTSDEFFAKLFPGEEPPPYQVVMIDYRMPGKNGLEILKELKQVRNSDIPAVIITGHGDEEMAAQVLKLGAADYIVKHTGYLFSLPSILENAHSRAQLERERKALRESELRYRSLFDHANDAIMILEEGRFVDCNLKTEQLFGMPRSAIIGTTPDELSPEVQPNGENSKKNAALVTNATLEKGEQLFEWRHQRGDGTLFDAEVSLSRVDLSGRVLIQAIVRDITERKQAEEALQKSEGRYRGLFEDSPISLWEEDFSAVKQCIEGLRRRGVKDFKKYFESHSETAEKCIAMIKVVDVNQATLKLFAAKNKDEIVKNIGTIIGTSGGNMVGELVNIAEGKTDFEWQGNNYTLNGERRVVSLRWSIAPGYEDSLSKVILSIVDVTERIHAEEKLRESERKLRRVIDESTDGILLTDEEGMIIEWNMGQEYISGLKREKVLGRPLWEVRSEVAFPDSKAHATLQDMRSATKQINKSGQAPGIGRVSDEELLRVTDGAHIYIQSVVFPIKTEKGFMICAITRDVTEQKGVIERLELQSTALGAAANGIFILDAKGVVIWVNPAFSKLTSYSFTETVGNNGTIFQTDLRNPDLYDDLSKTIQSGKIWGGELVGQRKDGSAFTVELTVTPVLGEKNVITGYIGIMNDITESLERKRELEATAHVSEALRVAQTREEMYPIILNQLMALLVGDAASIVMKDPATDELVIVAAAGEVETLAGVHLRLGQSVVSKVFASSKPYITLIEQEPNISFAELFKKTKSGAWYPLLAQSEVLGALFLGRSTPFEDTELRLIESVANMAANAFQRTRLFEQMQERLQQMEVQRDIDQAILTSFDLRMTLNILLRHLITQLKVTVADVMLLDTNTNDLEIVAGQGYSNAPKVKFHVKLGEGVAGKVLLEGKPLFIPDIQKAKEQFIFNPADFEELVSYYAVPLVAKGQPKGVLELMTRTPLRPTSEWKQFLETLARQAAIAIENAQMFETLQRSNTELLVAYDATIEGWVRALDMRDKETEGHTLRVADMMLDLAREMQISETDLVHVRRGALLHDIGKVGVPDGILLKPGPLTDEEWKIMRCHPQYAYDMLSPIAYLRPAIDIPYCHHEKWDGSGYPRGLKGEEIPLVARIFAIVDVWDALLSERPYRSAWSKKATLDYIRSQSGKHFDPKVVEAFIHWVENRQKSE